MNWHCMTPPRPPLKLNQNRAQPGFHLMDPSFEKRVSEDVFQIPKRLLTIIFQHKPHLNRILVYFIGFVARMQSKLQEC